MLARYGGGWRGIKPKVAYEHGAIGCLIYSDPRDDGYFAGDVYPGGPYRPEQGVQRGSVMDMPIHPGDPLSPGWASEPGGKKLARDASAPILKIPVLPISYGDALPLLKALKGPVAPPEWRGALPVTYHVGPGPAQVHMKLAFDWKNRPLYNVIVRIQGSTRPDEWIIFGNHHDAWVNGADDPISGAVALMETARGLAELLKTGWRPSRTIILALWDGEEWGLLGSTEWAEKHDAELKQKAAVYINTDGTGKGWLNAGGSHGLQQFMSEVARDVMDPRTGKPVFEEARRRAVLGEPEAERTAREKDAVAAARAARIGIGLHAVPAAPDAVGAQRRLRRREPRRRVSLGLRHHQLVPDVLRRRLQLRPHAVAADRHADPAPGRRAGAAVPVHRHRRHADALCRRAREAGQVEEGLEGGHGPVRAAVEALAAPARASRRRTQRSTRRTAARCLGRKELGQLNKLLLTSEQKLGNSDGLPRRDWFKHQIYAPGFYTGYGVKTMPQIREGLEEGRPDETREGVRKVADAIGALARQVDEAAALLKKALP